MPKKSKNSKKSRSNAINPKRLIYPWGCEEWFCLNMKCTIKLLEVRPKQMLSLQFHHKRDEFWKIMTGEIEVIVGNIRKKAKAGEEFWIKRGTIHRIIGGKKKSEILEISLGHFDENDIERIEDKYKRNRRGAGMKK